MKTNDSLPTLQAMKAGHKIRKFRRSNEEHGARKYIGNKPKPWASRYNPARSAA